MICLMMYFYLTNNKIKINTINNNHHLKNYMILQAICKCYNNMEISTKMTHK